MESLASSPAELPERLYKQLLSLPYDQLQQILFQAPVRPPAQAVTVKVKRDKRATRRNW